MDVFDTCHEINRLLAEKNEIASRNLLIRLLSELHVAGDPYPFVVNHMIRATGLYPYLQPENASWDERYVYKAFEVDVGRRVATLHREQSNVLSRLLEGRNIAVSAPTSFGKSFIIDAFIAARKPENIVIIVPTIALMDETRRRLFKKFSDRYTLITAPDSQIGSRNIFIFPQERVFRYLDRIEKIDLLVVDEFYKASKIHDPERSPSLIKAILNLSQKAEQRYYLAPNIKTIRENSFTRDMEFIELLDFNTVYLDIEETYKKIGRNEKIKGELLVELLEKTTQKTLIYAGTYTEIKKLSDIVINKINKVDRIYTTYFARWLRENYKSDWELADLVERAVGVHNGNMHRCLSQLQIRLFEYVDGFDTIISTSSIIEGVNTSAQNVVVWRSKLGGSNLKNFTYKNIIGRGGRMFKYFVGNVYLFDAPPISEDTQLDIEFPNEILGTIDEIDNVGSLNDDQIGRIVQYRENMSAIVGNDNFRLIKTQNLLNDSDGDFLLELARNLKDNPDEWRGFGYLNSPDPSDWETMLYKVIQLKPGGWGTRHSDIVKVTKIIALNWTLDLSEIIANAEREGIGIDDFFKLERTITFKLSALLHDVNELHKMTSDMKVDIGGFVGRLGRAFLPNAVYNLEEYGLPRTIAKKIQKDGLIDFNDSQLDLPLAIEKFQSGGVEAVLSIKSLSAFDRFIVKFFFDGITPDEPQGSVAEK